jgi:hypothetical protein
MVDWVRARHLIVVIGRAQLALLLEELLSCVHVRIQFGEALLLVF